MVVRAISLKIGMVNELSIQEVHNVKNHHRRWPISTSLFHIKRGKVIPPSSLDVPGDHRYSPYFLDPNGRLVDEAGKEDPRGEAEVGVGFLPASLAKFDSIGCSSICI